ncbi:hypothetical protein [Tsukamurella sp. USMM236]|uniref:hypothetical protein n=1 Tax=Tsukamurella sp. USMM236 TaxID=3081301 RepID=UPI0030183457
MEHAIGLWIISHNLHRRHLTTSHRAAIAVEYERVEAIAAAARRRATQNNKGGDSEPVILPEQSRGDARDKAAERFNVSGKSVSDAKFLAEHDPEAFERVRNGEQAVSAAAKEARTKNSPPKPEPTIEERAKKAAERIYREVALGRRSR